MPAFFGPEGPRRIDISRLMSRSTQDLIAESARFAAGPGTVTLALLIFGVAGIAGNFVAGLALGRSVLGTAATAQGGNESASAISARARAWSHMPPTMSHFLPHRSDSAPVTSCPTPHTAG